MAEMLERISSKELSEWFVYFEMEPFGEQQQEWRAGMLASTMASLFSKTETTPQTFMRKQYLPKVEPDEMTLTQKLDRAFSALGGKKRKG